MLKQQRAWTYGLLTLPLLIYGTFIIIPTAYSFYFSLTDWKLTSKVTNFVGLENFQRLARDPDFWQAFRNTAVWTVAALIVSIVIGFSIALLLSRMTYFTRFSKSAFFLPLALSLVVVGFTWTWIYRLDDGLLNQILEFIGLGNLAAAWLSDPETALPAVIIAWSWQQVPLAIVIYLAGLTAVSNDLMEASKLDGAKFHQQVRHVIIPAVRPATIVVTSLALINALKTFDIVYVMTQGGPFGRTETLAVLSYEAAFRSYEFGYASAIAVVLFVVTVAIIGTFTVITSRRGGDE